MSNNKQGDNMPHNRVNTRKVFKDFSKQLHTWKECVKCKKMIRPDLFDKIVTPMNWSHIQKVNKIEYICKDNCK